MSALMLVNPRKRRKGKKRKSRSRTRTVIKYRTRKSPRKRIRRRRNPIGARGMTGMIIRSAQNGAVGSLGAIAGTLVGNMLPLPVNLKMGNMGLIIDALIGISTGAIVGNFTNRKVGENMAQGAVTVALHGTMKNMIQTAMPQLNLNGYDDGLLAYDDLSAYDDDNDLGYAGAGMTSNDFDDDMGAYDDADNDDLSQWDDGISGHDEDELL